MNKTTTLLLFAFITLLAQSSEMYILQIASSASEKDLDTYKERFSKYKLMTQESGKYIVLYALELSKNDMDDIKKSVPDAVIKLKYKEKEKKQVEEKKQEQEIERKKVPQKQLAVETKPAQTSMTESLDMNDFQKARLLYSQKNYAGALKIFESFKNTPIDPKRLDFYVGRCNYEMQNYEQAMSAYERVLMEDPENLRVRLELAQTLLKLNLLKDAKKEYLYVLEKKEVPQSVKDNINIQLSFIEGKTKKDFVNITAIFGIGYDSNIDNGTDTQEYSVYVPQLNTNIPIRSARQIATLTYEAGAVVSHVRKVNDNFFIKNSATLYMQRYQNYAEKDMQIFSVNTTPTYTKDKNLYSLGLGLDHVWYGNVNFLNNYSLTPKYSYSISSTLLYDIYLKYARKAFYAPNQDKDSDTYELSNKISYINKEYGLFSGELVLGDEKKVKGVRTDVSKKYYAIKALHTYKFSEKLLLNTNINYESNKYQLEDVNFLNKRDDRKMLYSIGLMNISSKKLTLNLNAQYIKNSANQEPFDYDKYVIKSSLYYNF